MSSTGVDQDAMRVANRYAAQISKHETVLGRAGACRDAAAMYQRDAQASAETAQAHRAAARAIGDPEIAAEHERQAQVADGEARLEILAARHYEAQAEVYEAGQTPPPTAAADARDGQVAAVAADLAAGEILHDAGPSPTPAPQEQPVSTADRPRALPDRLKLAGKFDLEPGEQLLGTDKIASDFGAVRVALTDRDGARSVQLGIGSGVFGTREDDGGPWHGGPGKIAALNAERARLAAEEKALGDEWERLNADPQADQDRLRAVEDRLAELDDTDTNDLYPSGWTARLPLAEVEQLRSTLQTALAAGEVEYRRQDAYWAECERLEAVQDSLRGMSRLWTEEEDRRWDKATEALEALKATLPADGDEYAKFAEGTVPGQWADVHYLVDLDDVVSGVTVALAAVPHGSDQTLSDLVGNEQGASFGLDEAQKLVAVLGRYTAEH